MIMEKYDLIALDMDGTLCNDDKVIPQENLDAIRELQEQGKTVVVATGRPESGIMPFIEALQLEKFGGYVMSYNGCRIYDVKNKKTVFNKLFDRKYISKVLDIVNKSSITVTSPIDDRIVAGSALNDYSYAEAEIVKLPFHFRDDFLSWDLEMNKLLLIDRPEVIAEYYPILRDKFEPELHVFLSEPIFMEITPSGINKGNGLRELEKITGIRIKNMIAMGDSFNDIEMLETAGLGVAMANCKKGVEVYADKVTVTNNECGVAKIIREFML